MSADKFARLRELQRELVEELQREYFCEDVAVPTNAFGWSKDKIQAFFESGGAELSEQTMSDTTPVIRPSVANIRSAGAKIRFRPSLNQVARSSPSRP
jgi:hypothetical protein